MTAPLLDDTADGPPPLRRAIVGLVLGLIVGALAAAAMPRHPDVPPPLDVAPPPR